MKSSIACFVILFASTYVLLSRTVSGDEAKNAEGRIAGGSETTIQEHPYQVSVRKNRKHYCGGSIISTARVLAAAACVEPKESLQIYSILAGTADRTDDLYGQLREISKFTRHPEYDPPNSENDIAVLELRTPLVFGSTVSAIVLPPQGANISDGVLVTVTGWGMYQEDSGFSIILRAESVPIIWNTRCKVKLAKYERITPSMLCAGIPEGGLGSCPGDTGGPLVFQGILHGLRCAQLFGCGSLTYPRIYTRVSSFTTWIQNFI